MRIPSAFTVTVATLCACAIPAVTSALQYNSTYDLYFMNIDDPENAGDDDGIRFGGTLNKFLYYDKDLMRFTLNDDLRVVGDVNASGTVSGATIRSFGLIDCDNAQTSKLLWDTATGKFTCGTDQGGASGLTQNDADARYVNASGDTMTGSLTIDIGTQGVTNGGTALTVREHALFQSGATLSGGLILMNRNDPPAPPDDSFRLYSKLVSGRALLKARGPSGLDYPLQPSFFQNQICMLSAGATTTINSVGCSATNDTTLSTPTVTEAYGFMTNFATAATALDNAGTSSNIVSFFRGSTAGANGFFYYARVGVVDATDVRLFVGLANQTIGTMTDSDNPAGHHVGFQYTTARGDTTWQIQAKNNTTQTVTNTGMAVSSANVYDTYMFCSPQCTTITWRIDNLTTGTTQEGEISSTLPGATTAMRGIIGVGAVTTSAKNFRFQRMYIESDR